MKQGKFRQCFLNFLSSLLLTTLLVGAFLCAAAQDSKLKPEEVVAKHLEAIGSAEARAAIRSRVASGSVTVTNRIGGAGTIKGQAMMVSTGAKLRYGVNVPSQDYTGEQLAFNGERATTGFLPDGRRSQLSQFLNQQNLPLREGLIGGALSTAWPLLRPPDQQSRLARLEYRGLKSIEGRQLHELDYRPRKGSSDLQVKLYFDPETFQHVKTEYRFQVGARAGTVGNDDFSATAGTNSRAAGAPGETRRQDESYYVLTEDFDDFRAIEGLTLPHKYKLQISVQTGRGAMISDWAFSISRISHKEQFDEQIFTIK